MSLPKPINWLRGSREATGWLHLVRMIDTAPTGSLSGVEQFEKTHGQLEYYTAGIITSNEIPMVRNSILNRVLEVNPDLTSVGDSPHLVWFQTEEDPDYWDLYFMPKGQQSGKSPDDGQYNTDYYTVATIENYRLNDLDL
jgi:hypothetical protein